jgi:hypothetical protein
MTTRSKVIACALASLASFSCWKEHGVSHERITGDVGIVLVFGPYQVSSAHYVLTNGSLSYEGNLPVNGSQELRVKIGSVVAADDYSLTVTADSADASFRCRGTAGPFSITHDEPARVALGFACERAPEIRVEGGGWELNANECPDIRSVVAGKVDGCSILMHVDAVDADHSPSQLSYAWSNGMSGASPTLQCTSEGPLDLQLTVSDGDQACDAEFAVKVMCPAGCGVDPTDDAGLGTSDAPEAGSGDAGAPADGGEGGL